jgi:hypothetical protein
MLINVTPKNYRDKEEFRKHNGDEMILIAGVPLETFYAHLKNGVYVFNGGAENLREELFGNDTREERKFIARITDNNKTLPRLYEFGDCIYEPLLVKIKGVALFIPVVNHILEKGVWRRAEVDSHSIHSKASSEIIRGIEEKIAKYNQSQV